MSLRQINLIKSCKKFYENFRSNNFHLYKDTPVYLASYSNSIGLKVLTSFENKNKLDINFITILKDIFYSLNYLNNKIIFSDNRYFYDKIIITWAYKNNFKKDGSLQDRYFNCNSQTLKNTLWFVVYLDNRRPNKLKKNIILFTPNKGRRYNILILIKKLFKYSPYIFKNFKYFLLLMSNHNFFSQIFLQRFKFFFNKKVKKIIMPYEGQPFQNKVIEYTKKKNKKLKVIGYVHSPPLAMPSNFIFKSFSPDLMILNGKDQIYCFEKILGWKRRNLILKPSFRFRKGLSQKKNGIFLPLSVRSVDEIIRNLKILNKKKIINLKKMIIHNHPAASNSAKNIKLLNDIEKIKKEIKKNSLKKDVNIFIGNSGGIIEALERGKKVIQICENPVIDYYSKKVWPSIISKNILNNVFSYKLKKKGNLIQLGSKKTNLNRIFNNL